MASKEMLFPSGSLLQYPDGSMYQYAEAADDMEQGTFVEASPMGRLIRFKGGLRFPQGIVMETVPKGSWTFVMIRPPQVKEKPIIEVPTAAANTEEHRPGKPIVG